MVFAMRYARARLGHLLGKLAEAFIGLRGSFKKASQQFKNRRAQKDISVCQASVGAHMDRAGFYSLIFIP